MNHANQHFISYLKLKNDIRIPIQTQYLKAEKMKIKKKMKDDF